MRHRVRGRKLGRNASHRKAMFRNMACSLIRSVRVDEDDPQRAKVPGRIVTTVPKAKELRPYLEKLVTLAKKAIPHLDAAEEYETSAERNSNEWKEWRNSEQWNKWNQATAPALALRRKAFSILRDNEVVDILFNELAERFESRPGGYTRIVKLAKPRLGDAGAQAFIEFVGDPERDRVRSGQRNAPVVSGGPAVSDSETSESGADEVSDDTAETAEGDASASEEASSGEEESKE